MIKAKLCSAGNLKKHMMFFVLYAVLAIFMTYPLILHMDSSVSFPGEPLPSSWMANKEILLRNPSDPFLNTWILAWNVRRISQLDFKGFFDTNIFYPDKKTLAYSEYLIPQSLIALPIIRVSGNPILAHNLIILVSFVTTAFGMYLLVRHLTANFFSAFVAGTIFAFSPFMFSNIDRVQIIFAGLIPLACLYLNKFSNGERVRDILLFTFFFILQLLGNGYYGMYLALFAGCYILYYAVSRNRYRLWRFWIKLGLCATCILIFVGPLYYQYVWLRWALGFVRHRIVYAHPTSYLSTPSINWIYGTITAPFWNSENQLFFGIVASVLAFIALRSSVRQGKSFTEPPLRQDKLSTVYLRRILDILVSATVLLILIIVISGGFEVVISGLRVRATHAKNPTLFIMFLVVIRVAVTKRLRTGLVRVLTEMEESHRIYVIMLFCSVLFAFGPYGPYSLLYYLVPGFDGLRVASRFHIMSMLSVAVLAGYGINSFWRNLTFSKQIMCIIAIPLLILAEYMSLPVPLHQVPVKQNIPEVYQWLAQQEGDFAVMEYPIGISEEYLRVYYSTYHWKKIVNGFSGYPGPTYKHLLERHENRLTDSLLTELRTIGVRFLIIHKDALKPERWSDIISFLEHSGSDMKLIREFSGSRVYDLISGSFHHFRSGLSKIDAKGQAFYNHPTQIRTKVQETPATRALSHIGS